MGLLKQTDDQLLDEIRGVSKRLAKVEGQLDVAKEQLKLSEEVVGLKKQLVSLEVERDKKQEEYARREREVKHNVGLLKKQQDVEMEQAKREAVLEVREENLAADRSRFEEQMKFTTQHMQREIERIERIATELMKRLPNVEVNKKLDLALTGSNGDGDED